MPNRKKRFFLAAVFIIESPRTSLHFNVNVVIFHFQNPNSIANSNTPRLAYVMQSGPSGVPTRQLVLTTNNSVSECQIHWDQKNY